MSLLPKTLLLFSLFCHTLSSSGSIHDIGDQNSLHAALTHFLQTKHFSNKIRPNSRHLESFEHLNNVLSGVILVTDDFYQESEPMFGMSVQFWGSNVVCQNLTVENVTAEYRIEENKQLNMPVNLMGLKLVCEMDWRYKWHLLEGNGTGQISIANSTVDATLTFESEDFSLLPPSSVNMSRCSPDIQIVDTQFQGGQEARILQALEEPIRGEIEEVIKGEVCVEMSGVTDGLYNVIAEMGKTLNLHITELPANLPDVLYAEKNIFKREDVSLVDLSVLDGMVNDVFPSMDKGTAMMSAIERLMPSTMAKGTVIKESPNTMPSLFPRGGILIDSKNKLIDSFMKITQIRVIGLGDISSIDPYEVIGKYTVKNHIFWDNIDIEMDSIIFMKPSLVPGYEAIQDNSTEHTLREDITIKTSVKDLSVNVSLLLGIDYVKLFNMELGMLLNSKNMASCLLDTIHIAKIAGITTSMKSIEDPVLEGFQSPGVDYIYTTAMRAAFDMYLGSIMTAVPNFVRSQVGNIVNDNLVKQMEQAKQTDSCHSWQAENENNFLNFPDLLMPPEDAVAMGGSGKSPYGNIGYNAMEMLDKTLSEIDPIDGSAIHINKFLAPFSTMEFGTLVTVKRRLRMGGFKADLELKVFDSRIEQIDSIGAPLKIFQPVGSHSINNTATIGVGKALRAKFKFFISLNDGADIQVKNLLDIGIDFDALTAVLTSLLKMRENSVLQFPLKDVLNYNCWLATMPPPALNEHGVRLDGSDTSMAIEHLAMSLKQLRLSVSCTNCTSPVFEQLAHLLSSESSIAVLTKSANEGLKFLETIMQDRFGQIQIDRMLATAPAKCPHHPSYNPYQAEASYKPFQKIQMKPDSFEFVVVLACVIGALAIVAGTTFLIVQCVVRIRHRKWITTLSEEQLSILREEQLRKDHRNKNMNESTRAMITSPAIPFIIRFSIPIIILGNIAFFLSGHLNLGATVNISVNIGGNKFVIKNFFQFSMGLSITDMWKAGAKELAVLLAIFSGVWPYTKQLISLFLWFAPPKWVSVSRRGSIYLWLDVLGKWSFADIFVLVMSVVSFRIQVANPLEKVFGDNIYALDLMVIPVWGLYANMIAQLISQCSSHVIIHYHRRIVRNFDLENGYREKEESGHDHALCHHAFNRAGMKKGKGLVLRQGVNKAIIFLAVATAVLLIVGCIFPQFSLDTLGMVGIAIESGQNFEEAKKSYNIFNMVAVLMEQAGFVGGASNLIGMITLSMVLIGTVLVVPLAQLGLIVYRWFGHIPCCRARRRIAVAIESLQAWQYVEVYILSIIIATWQLGPVSEYMINAYCGSLDGFFFIIGTLWCTW